LANIIDFAQAKSNKKIGQTRFSSTCFESRLSLKGWGVGGLCSTREKKEKQTSDNISPKRMKMTRRNIV